MEYKTIVTIYRKGKEIYLFLKEGEKFSYENIIDVEIYTRPECSMPEEPECTKYFRNAPYDPITRNSRAFHCKSCSKAFLEVDYPVSG